MIINYSLHNNNTYQQPSENNDEATLYLPTLQPVVKFVDFSGWLHGGFFISPKKKI